MKLTFFSAALMLLFSLPLAAESSFDAKIEGFAGDLFFPVYGANAEAVVKGADFDKLNQHTDKLNQHTDKLNQHTDKLNQHTDKLNQHTDKLNQRGNDIQVQREDGFLSKRGNKSRSFLAASGGFFSAKPGLSQFDSDIYSGFGKIQAGNSKLDFSVGAFGASLPGETKILSKKPRFTLEDGQFAGVFSSASLHFSQNFGVSFCALAANGGFGWGDLYYFYGHPKNAAFYGGKVSLDLPFKTDVFAAGGSIEFKIAADNTEAGANLGHAGANLGVFGAKKRFLGEKEEKNWWLSLPKPQPAKSQNHHALDALALFSYADYFGSARATPETQDYFFFPYNRIEGHADGKLFAAGGGISYKYSRASFEGGASAFYIQCLSNPSSAAYSYQYKKNILFDGSSKSSGCELADLKNCGLLAGKISLSYNFKRFFHLKSASPELKLSRLFALPVLTSSARKSLHYLSGKQSSSAGGMASSKPLGKLKTALLAGTVVSLRIEF